MAVNPNARITGSSTQTSGVFPLYYTTRDTSRLTQIEKGYLSDETTIRETTVDKTKILGITIFSSQPVVTTRTEHNNHSCTIL